MRSRWRWLLAVTLGLALVAAACSSTTLTVDDIRDQAFDNSDELVAWLECDGQWTSVTGSLVGSSEVDWNAKKVVDTAKELMGTDEPRAATDAILAGGMWVLIDAQGRPFGGMEPGRALIFCSDR